MSRNTKNVRLSALTLSIGLACLAPGGALAQGSAASAAAGAKSVPSADAAFAKKAAIGGMAEVAMGKLAQQKAQNDQVKQFGARMVDDHSKANDELKQIASAKGIALPSEPDAQHKSKMAKMEKLSGAAFDRAYMDEMVGDHKHDVADFRKEASSGKDSDLKAFASKTLPTLEDHLKMAQATDAAVKNKK
jgi:putative membrane protein